jgi:ArsR family transcriptional regulator, arsenate/arsenite/antimonite-responsive transcriptional repressor
MTLSTAVGASAPQPLSVPSRDSIGPALGLTTLNNERSLALVQLFKLLADETRLQILNYLSQTPELNVRRLCELLEQSQPAVSHHLAMLREAGLLECRRDGKHNFYHLIQPRCREYLDLIFASGGGQPSQIRVADALVTYGREGQTASLTG